MGMTKQPTFAIEDTTLEGEVTPFTGEGYSENSCELDLTAGLDFSNLMEADLRDDIELDFVPENINLIDETNKVFSSNPSMLKMLAKDFSVKNMRMIESAMQYPVDLVSAYASDEDFKAYLKFAIKGFVVGKGYETVIPNTVKLFLIDSDNEDNLNIRSFQSSLMWKSFPAIKSMDKEAINAQIKFFPTHATIGKELFAIMEEECSEIEMENLGTESKVNIAMYDNHTLATALSKKADFTLGTKNLLKAGLGEERVKTISILAKAIKDSRI